MNGYKLKVNIALFSDLPMDALLLTSPMSLTVYLRMASWRTGQGQKPGDRLLQPQLLVLLVSQGPVTARQKELNYLKKEQEMRLSTTLFLSL